MSEPSTNGTTFGYKAATMYVISEKGLESGPFLYGKPTDSRVFSEYHNGEYFSSGLNCTSQMDSQTKRTFRVELGPRRSEKICVINLNDVLCKYKKKFPCDKLKGIDQSEVSRDPSCIYKESFHTESKKRICNDLPDTETLLPEGRIVNEDDQQAFLSIRGSKNIKTEHNFSGEAKFHLANLQRSVHLPVHKPCMVQGTFWSETKRNEFALNVHHRTEKEKDEYKTVGRSPYEKADRRLGELILLKRIYSSKEKARNESKISAEDTAEKRAWERKREIQHRPRKQLPVAVEVKAENPSKSLGKKPDVTVVSAVKLPAVATGMASKNPVTFGQKYYDRWSRQNKKIAPNLSFTEAAKSGKSLLPSIAKKC